MKKNIVRKINVAQKKKGLPVFKESVNEGQKRDSHKAYMKYYKAYEVFARETMELAKTTSKLSGEKTDEKIIIKNFKKYVIPFAGLMNS
jgi:translation initiation factor 2 alpha subunit (eIF-2alpha)